jgi:hypothetical protein
MKTRDLHNENIYHQEAPETEAKNIILVFTLSERRQILCFQNKCFNRFFWWVGSFYRKKLKIHTTDECKIFFFLSTYCFLVNLDSYWLLKTEIKFRLIPTIHFSPIWRMFIESLLADERKKKILLSHVVLS